MPSENQELQNKTDSLPAIRTFQRDAEEMLRREQLSLSEIALAEAEKKRAQQAESATSAAHTLRAEGGASLTESPPGPLPNSVSPRESAQGRWYAAAAAAMLAFALLAAGGGIFLYRIFAKPPQATPAPLSPEAAAGLRLRLSAGETRAGFIKRVREAIAAAPIAQNETKALEIRLGDAPLTAPLLFERLSAAAPAPLLRALEPTMTVGIHAFRGARLFLLFGVRSFDNAFDSMLAYEPSIIDDLGPLLGINPRELAGEASTTAEALGVPSGFKDSVIRNRDARAIFDREGTIVFLYSFLDKQTLLISSSEDTLKTLVTKARNGTLY